MGQKTARDRSSFWAGMIMGAATATGGFFALKGLEKVFAKKGAQANPASLDSARARLMLAATNPGAPMPAAADKAPVVKRTVIEEMVEDIDAD